MVGSERCAHQCDIGMDLSIGEEPMHYGALRWKRVRILFRFVLDLLLLCELWAVAARDPLLQSSTMRWWAIFVGHAEDQLFSGCRCMGWGFVSSGPRARFGGCAACNMTTMLGRLAGLQETLVKELQLATGEEEALWKEETMNGPDHHNYDGMVGADMKFRLDGPLKRSFDSAL